MDSLPDGARRCQSHIDQRIGIGDKIRVIRTSTEVVKTSHPSMPELYKHYIPMANMWSEVEPAVIVAYLYILILQHHAVRQWGPVNEAGGPLHGAI